MATGNSPVNVPTPSQQVLKNNFDELVNSVDLKSLYQYLVKYDMLTENLKQKYFLPSTTDLEKKQQIFTAILANSQPSHLQNLIKCLEESAKDHPGLSEHNRIAQKLKRDLNYANNASARENIRQNVQVHNHEVTNLQTEGITVERPMPGGIVENGDEDRHGEQQNEDQAEDNENGNEREPLVQRDPNVLPVDEQHVAPRWFSERVCKWGCRLALIWYPLVFILCLSCFIAAGMVTWNNTKDLPTTYSVPVADSQTVLVPLQPNIDARYVHSLKLQLMSEPINDGGGDSGESPNCESKSIIIPCSSLSKSHKSGVTSQDPFFKHYQGLFYLLNGSAIHVNYKASDDHLDPASIWIFNNAKTADDSIGIKPQCSDPKYTGYGQCRSLTKSDTITFDVTNNSIYYIRCFQKSETAGNCLKLDRLSWSIDVYWYNFSQYADTNRTDVTVKNITNKQKTRFTLQKIFDPVHYNTDPNLCILVRKLPTPNLCVETVDVVVSDVTKVEDAWLFTAVVATVVLAMFVVIAVVVHIGCWVLLAKKLRDNDAPV